MKLEERYQRAIEKYPDLKNLGSMRLSIFAYQYRKEQERLHTVAKTIELANGRCNLQVKGFDERVYPIDLPNLYLLNECVVCRLNKKTIQICPDCWRNIRKCLDLKGKSHREGWEGWGVEMNLDLKPLVQMLKREPLTMKKEATKYYNLCLWFAQSQDSKKYTTNQFEQVLGKIGFYEDKLRVLDVSEEKIQELIDQVAKAYSDFLGGSTKRIC